MSKRTKYSKGKKPPLFIQKLHDILQDQANKLIVKWRQDEQSFIILHIPKFSEFILPKYYKHSNFSSFVRQLHMYNFTKMRVQVQGQHVYTNQHFFRGNLQNFKQIRRKEVTANKNNLLALTNNLNNQIQSNNFQEQSVELRQSNSQSFAAPSQAGCIFQNSPHLGDVEFNDESASENEFIYAVSPKISNVIPLPSSDNHLQYLQNILVQMKESQNQLQQICLSLYKQNKTLTTQNKLLQQKVCRQWNKKENNLNQIMKYVVQYLQQWNHQDPYYEFKQTNPDKSESPDVISQSYQEVLSKSKKINQKKYNHKKANMFQKYSKTDLIHFLQEIQNIFRSNVLFSELFDQKECVQSNFLSMIMKFVQNNQLTQVLKAFSMFMNIERNRKKKNYTVIQKKEKLQLQKNQNQNQNIYAIQLQYLQQERICIKQMEEQIFMIEECQQLKHSNSPTKHKPKDQLSQIDDILMKTKIIQCHQSFNMELEFCQQKQIKNAQEQYEMKQILNNFKYFLE